MSGEWIPIEDASGAFERPSWAIAKLVARGELEKKVEGGRTFVRAPRPSAPVPGHLEELVALLEPLVASEDFVPASEPAAEVVTAIVARALEAEEPRPVTATVDAPAVAALDELAQKVDELLRSQRARDAFLVRAAQALLAVEEAQRRAASRLETGPQPIAPPKERSKGRGLIPAFVALAVCAGAGWIVREERARAEEAIARAAELARVRAMPAMVAVAPAPVGTGAVALAATLDATVASTATVASSAPTATLPAGFRR